MSDPHPIITPDWPFLVYGGLVVLLLAVILGLSYLLGQHHNDRETGQPYESGIMSTGSARLRFSSQFYLMAMMFVIFDIEVVFIVLWALAFQELGWPGYIAISLFISLLVAVLIYEWSIGALDFGPDGKKLLKHSKKFIIHKSGV
jgi:NADH-quinone oxidoreductase subunit A